MAMHVPKAPGFSQMLKEGARHFHGLEEAVFRNIEACKQLTRTVRSAYGPRGMNKMIINHLEKLFVTSDAATIIKELEVQHPAAKMMVLASQMQEQEVGDGTNFVIILAGALLECAEELIRMGLTPVEVAEGYEMAGKKILDLLPTLTCGEIKDYKNVDEVTRGIRAAVMSKQYGNEDFLAQLIAKACISLFISSSQFNILDFLSQGAGVYKSEVVQGMVFKRQIESNITKATSAKVAVYTCPIDSVQTETKGTVLINTAEELMNFSRGEESLLEKQIKAIADVGVTVVVAGGKIGDMALHYLNKYGLMGVRLMSKFDVRRLCRTVGATALPKMTAPTPEEVGFCDLVYVDEIGETPVVVFKQESKESRISTIVVRGSTDNLMDDIERAIDDGVNTFKAITRDGRLLPGAGAIEIELAKEIASYGETLPGIEQYPTKKLAEVLEALPKALADNAGVESTELISKLHAAHHEGKKNVGLDIESDNNSVKDAVAAGITDLYLTKFWGIKYALNAACTILRVDEIIMAKPAGGPKPKSGGGDMDED
ncbi:T-complex protein 1 subunit theta-like [Limulus polyphemus]|uniref:T-complex protein 1 subunit theta n=1 Tax=Limulus polyphemus TaxID=6850 RepID=A0ABM1C538_LIMPO|nr:T-complex protein 1 subunit theta-like [Limulus polyphemus]